MIKQSVRTVLGATILLFGFASGLFAQTQLQITTNTLPDGRASVTYGATFNATGGTTPYTWTNPSGTLPPGLSLSSSGFLSGTINAGTTGSFTFVIQVADSAAAQQIVSRSFTINVPSVLSITTTSLPDGRLSTVYAAPALSATGGTQPYSWAIVSGALPSGLTLSSSGVISGTPQIAGSFTFSVRATDSGNPAQTATQSLTIKVPPVITTSTLPNGLINSPYSQTLAAAPTTATPLNWSITAGGATLAAAGLSITDSTNGVFGGTPTASGTFNFTVTVTDSAAQTATANLSVTIQAALTITETSPLPAGEVGAFYTKLIATSGPTPSSWTVLSGVLPPGLSLSSSGSLTGTPGTAGTFTFTAQATATGPTQTAQQTFSITINPALSILTGSLPNATLSTAYSATLNATGGVAPYTWTALTSLPANLSLSAAGAISGTPQTLGTFSFTVQLADSLSPPQTISRQFSITVVNTLTISTATLANGSVGTNYSQTLSVSSGTSPFVWSVSAGTLPAGLTLSTSGTISGNPTTAGTSSVTFSVTDSSIPAQTATKVLSITILAPSLTITTASPLPTGVSGVFYNLQLAATGPSPQNWSVISGVLPPGLSLTSSGSIVGTPSIANTFDFTVQATAGSDPVQTVTKVFRLVISTSLSITTTAVPDAIVATAYSVTLVAAGGVAPYTFSVPGRGLPPGITLSTGGVLSGTPTTAGTFTFTVNVSDSFTPTQQANRTYVITVATTLTITSATLANGVVGVAYTPLTLTAAAGTIPYTWSVSSGSLPSGLSLSTDGIISGTPLGAGTSTLTISAKDSATPQQTATKTFTITIQASLTITSTSQLPLGVVGSFYSQLLQATGPTPMVWNVVSGIAPPGLTLTSNGTLAGTPAVAGTYDFTVQVSAGDPAQTVRQAFRMVVNAALTITNLPALPGATPSVPYTVTLTATGGVAPYVWSSSGALPPGLNLSSTGILSGIPTTAGSYQFTIQATDNFTPANTASRTFTLTVASTLTITTATLPNGAPGIVYSQTLAATAGTTPYTWSLVSGAIPSGVTLSSAGAFSGTPTIPGTYSFVVMATDSSTPAQTVSKSLAITIQPLLTITTATNLPLGVVGAFYSQLFEAAGPTQLTWSVVSGIAPPGLTLVPSGTLAGAPIVSGTFDFTIQAASTDPVQTDKKAFHVVVNAALAIVTPAPLPDATAGGAYSVSLVTTGGLAPYTWTNPGPSLPPGVTLSSAGVISGTPIAIGTFSFALLVTDSYTPAQQATRTFTLSIKSGLSITTLTLPNGIKNVAYNQQLQATGSAPFAWTVSGGTLPIGITLSAAGVLQGTPTAASSQTITITVTDSRGGAASRDFVLTIDPPLPTLSVKTLPVTLSPTQTSEIALTLDTPHPSDLSGTLRLTFTSNAEVPSDDPATQFSTGARTATFTIAANTTAAVFDKKITLLTGTVSGTVKLTANFDNGPSDVAVATVEIPAVAPKMTDAGAVRTSGGLDVQITGYASSRRVTSVEFDFEVKTSSSSKTETVTLTRNVEADFATWYRNPASIPFGSSFSFLQSFAISGGDANSIVSVTVRLTNAQGSTTSSTITPR